MDDWEKTLYIVAEKLHMPVYKIKAEMPLPELLGWVSHIRSSAEPAKEEPIDLTKATPEQLKGLFG